MYVKFKMSGIHMTKCATRLLPLSLVTGVVTLSRGGGGVGGWCNLVLERREGFRAEDVACVVDVVVTHSVTHQLATDHRCVIC